MGEVLGDVQRLLIAEGPALPEWQIMFNERGSGIGRRHAGAVVERILSRDGWGQITT